MSEEKLLPFRVYRRRYPDGPPSARYCVASVHESGRGVGFHQCGNKPKHQYGGYGWCTLHYPPNAEKRRRERHAKWKSESEARQAKWKAEADERKLKDAALEAIRKIAAGHNDPRALAQEVLKDEH